MSPPGRSERITQVIRHLPMFVTPCSFVSPAIVLCLSRAAFPGTVRSMYFRPAFLVLSVALLLSSGTGCQKNEFCRTAFPPTILSPDTIASVHWLGKKRLG